MVERLGPAMTPPTQLDIATDVAFHEGIKFAASETAALQAALAASEEKGNRNPDYVAIVSELNDGIYERFGETEHGFSYSTNGYVDSISFDEMLLWDSEGCGAEREWDEEKCEYEPFLPFIKRTFNERVDTLHTFRYSVAADTLAEVKKLGEGNA
jgi:hypothetical protein